MQQYMDFVVNHWGLWLLFIIILALLMWNELRSQVSGVFRINPQQLINLLNHDNAKVIDIRSSEDFKNGHILGAKNIPGDAVTAPEQIKKLQKFKAKPMALVCANGQQSLKFAIKLRQAGFTQMYALHQGIGAWRQANLPMTKD